ncbi:biofilm PGA synthesis protein PgaD [Pseudoxanthomonas sp. 3HH-4]|uniref:poly-beta-1,6-N-acetyl-D-glucosamine biosynthesis protein PgaD n=1 Tax=unclassified Pseudoxanthomonas TaxID=2645906 RepID=UPI0011505C19|nr:MULTISPECIES: poly-beta-1,6-N-acetyl-D-glucosamine biosynthesis protein PgaD [unclassified Pseudoxanthomonas]TQM10410.1 biofilm PGA synthesis protein PgaD [Pseudoxanthomonas sp. 3HH-4]WFC43451.1 poly-beta-1,6-N-acetyl-D-glucosamine biosynthesis protein PgaD [Pseudoxanthomonas sp. SE1]
MKFDSRLIRKPMKQPRLQRAAWGFVTLGFWMVYVYLWTPLATLLLWLLGFRTAFFELYVREHAIEPFLLFSLPLLAVACALMLIAWAEYNRLRFSRVDRRSQPRSATLPDVAQALGAPPAVARALVQGKITVLHMGEDACPHGFTAIADPG